MPTPNEILAGLTAIAQDWRLVAVVWHILVGAGLVAIILGWRPERRLAASLLALPLLSVSLFAWIAGNPFNGTVFLVFALLLFFLARKLPNEPVQNVGLWPTVAGSMMIAFGWVYPHFLEVSGFLTYFYAAPTGLVPCPTLSVVIGFALLAGGFRYMRWSNTLAVLGLFYGAFGVFRLGVVLDTGLMLGAIALLLLSFRRVAPTSPMPEVFHGHMPE